MRLIYVDRIPAYQCVSTELWVHQPNFGYMAFWRQLGGPIAGRENVREFQGSLATTQHKRNPSMAHQAVVDNMFHGYMSNTGRRTHLGKAQTATNLELLRRENLPSRLAAAARPWPPPASQIAGGFSRGSAQGSSPRGGSRQRAITTRSPPAARRTHFPEHNQVWHDRVGRGPNHRLPGPPQSPRRWSPAAGSAEKAPSQAPIMLWKTLLTS